MFTLSIVEDKEWSGIIEEGNNDCSLRRKTCWLFLLRGPKYPMIGYIKIKYGGIDNVMSSIPI